MQRSHRRIIAGCVMILGLFMGILFSVKAEAASVQVRYGGENHTYYKVIKKVYVNGKKISLSKTPIFMKSGAYVGPAEPIFKEMLGLRVTSNTDPSAMRLAITNGSNRLVMKSGSRKGVLNAVYDKMGSAVWYLTYTKSKKKSWVVPLKSVCTRLGLYYRLSDGVIYIDSEAPAEEDAYEDESVSKGNDTGKKIVLVLDAGHGGVDSGARGNGLIEKNMTLQIILAAKKYFDKDRRFKVYYTRTSDVYPSLKARYKLANSKKADLFVSAHINSAYKTSTGTETLVSLARSPKTQKNNINSIELARMMQLYARASTGYYDRGLKNRPKLQVLRYTKMPSCLIEYGFLSNRKEALNMNANLPKYGRALYNGVVALTKKKGLY